MERKKWDSRDMSCEEVELKIEELEEQVLVFEMNVRYELKQDAFRDVYLAWYEQRLTLEELLKAMMDRSICKRITPFARH